MERLALVTGGTRGIGAAVSIALRDAGYRVAANFVGDEARAASFSEKNGIAVYQWDVADGASCRNGLKRVVRDYGPVDVLVNNAGITRDRAFHKMSEEDWFSVLNIDLNSCYHMCRGVMPSMRERGFGRIVNMSSLNGQRGRFGQANYSTAKAGMIGLTKALAQEGARHGITVNAVAPGHIETELLQAASETLIQMLKDEIPVGRLGTPKEVARCVVFLAAEEAGFITGSTLTINGGTYMI